MLTKLSLQVDQENDVQLLHAIARGETAALTVLYDRYRRILFGLSLRILRRQADAEDVVQEVFIQVWQRAGRFDETRGRPFTWLVTLTRSRAIDRLRNLNARERVAQEAHNLDSSPPWGEATTEIDHSERRRLLQHALSHLSEEQRRALLLAYFHGFSQSEIATHLATPLGTIKTRVRSGLLKLRELLAPQAEEFQ